MNRSINMFRMWILSCVSETVCVWVSVRVYVCVCDKIMILRSDSISIAHILGLPKPAARRAASPEKPRPDKRRMEDPKYESWSERIKEKVELEKKTLEEKTIE